MVEIHGYHAHVYFDKASRARAGMLTERASGLFALRLGKMHEKPVGPHPRSMCQLAFSVSLFAEVVPWLSLNRDGLTVLIHPETGDNLKDHTDHAMWMGEVLELSLERFS